MGNANPKHEPQSSTELNIRVLEYQEKPQERKRRLHDSIAPIMEGIVEWILKEGGTKCQEMEHLLYQSGAEIPITEGLLKEAAENNNGCYGYEAMKLLFQH